MTHASVGTGEGKINGHEQGWAWWYGLMVCGEEVPSAFGFFSPIGA